MLPKLSFSFRHKNLNMLKYKWTSCFYGVKKGGEELRNKPVKTEKQDRRAGRVLGVHYFI